MKKEPSSDLDSSGIGGGSAVKGKTYRRDDNKNHLRCNHCGGTRHTKSECFKLVGYREWWPDAKKKGTRCMTKFSDNRTDRASIGLSTDGGLISEEEREEGVALNSTTGNEEKGSFSLITGTSKEKRELGYDERDNPNELGHALNKWGNQGFEKSDPSPSFCNALSIFRGAWIFDCGATDTMSYDPNDFVAYDKPMKNIIKTANGEGIKVEGAGIISFTENITLKNYLFVPDLSHKLLSVNQLTRDLDCTVLMKLGCCIVQDAQTRQTIGRGIERGGLYNLEKEVQKGKAVLVHESEERQLRTWHRRVSRETFSYFSKA